MTFQKDPLAVLDYAVDWLRWLAAGDVISASTWIVPPELVKRSDTWTDTKCTIWLAGGTSGQTYTVTNRIVTAAGRTESRSFSLKVAER